MDLSVSKEKEGTINGYINKVFMWLFIGLMISFGSSLVWKNLIYVPNIMFFSIAASVAVLVVAFCLIRVIFKLNPTKAKILYIVYCLRE